MLRLDRERLHGVVRGGRESQGLLELHRELLGGNGSPTDCHLLLGEDLADAFGENHDPTVR